MSPSLKHQVILLARNLKVGFGLKMEKKKNSCGSQVTFCLVTLLKKRRGTNLEKIKVMFFLKSGSSPSTYFSCCDSFSFLLNPRRGTVCRSQARPPGASPQSCLTLLTLSASAGAFSTLHPKETHGDQSQKLLLASTKMGFKS